MLMYLAPGALFAQTVTTDRAPGFHPAPFMVRLSASTTGATIHYTTDGSAPTEASPVFAAPIAIAPADTIRLAYIPTNHNVRADERWRAPTGRVFRGMVVRARARRLRDGDPPPRSPISSIRTASRGMMGFRSSPSPPIPGISSPRIPASTYPDAASPRT